MRHFSPATDPPPSAPFPPRWEWLLPSGRADSGGDLGLPTGWGCRLRQGAGGRRGCVCPSFKLSMGTLSSIRPEKHLQSNLPTSCASCVLLLHKTHPCLCSPRSGSQIQHRAAPCVHYGPGLPSQPPQDVGDVTTCSPNGE